MKKVNQVILLAGGGSSRFYPYNSFGHKSLLILCGKPLIVHTLEALEKHGIKEVVIVEGSSNDVSQIVQNYKFKNLLIQFVVQKKPLGMGDALLTCEKILNSHFFLLNAYHFEAIELLSVLQASVEKESGIAVLTREEENMSEFGSIVKKNGKIKISEKSEKGKGSRVVGIYLLNQSFFKTLQNTAKHEYAFEDALSVYSKDHTLVLVDAKNPTLSLKFPWNVLDAKDILLNILKPSISKNAKISKGVQLLGDVTLEDGVEIMEGVVIRGPAFIGKNVLVGNNAILRKGVSLEEGVVIGANMEVKNAVIMDRSTTHSGFIGDSVIGQNTKIAAGFNTANVRLDRREISSLVKNKKTGTGKTSLGAMIGSNNSIGIKVGTMPGIIIGNNTIIGPGTTVMENIPDDISYYTEFKKIVKK